MCAHARAADTNTGSTSSRGRPASGSPRLRSRGRRGEAATCGGSLRTRGGATSWYLADTAPAHGGPALPAVAALARARRGRVRLPPHGRVPAAGRAEAKATPKAAETRAG